MSKVRENNVESKRVELSIFQQEYVETMNKRRLLLIDLENMSKLAGEGYLVSADAVENIEKKISKCDKELERLQKHLDYQNESAPQISEEDFNDYKKMKEMYGIDSRTREQVKHGHDNEPKVVSEVKTYEPADPIIKRTKDRGSNSLGGFLRNFMQEMDMSRTGYDMSSMYDVTPPDGRLSNYKEPQSGVRDDAVVAAYRADWEAGKIHPEEFFGDKEGNLKKLVKQYFDSKVGTRDNEYYLSQLNRHFNVTARQLLWSDEQYKDHKEFSDELFSRKSIKESYKNNKAISSFGSNNGRNLLKEAAWIAVHSYLIDVLLSAEKVYQLIPGAELQDAWNGYINDMADVPEPVKMLFRVFNNGACAYKKQEDMFDRDNQTIAANNATVSDGPTDDDPVPFADAIVVDALNREMNKEYHEAMARDTANEVIIDAPVIEVAPADVKEVKEEDKIISFTDAVVPAEKKTRKSFGDLQKESKAKKTSTKTTATSKK